MEHIPSFDLLKYWQNKLTLKTWIDTLRALPALARHGLVLVVLLGTTNAAQAFCAAALIKEIQQITQLKVVTDAVKTSNARQLSKMDISNLDKKWIKQHGKVPEAVQIQTSEVSSLLMKEVEKRIYFTEAILTGNQGETVGMNMVTTDYWQGDEDKFTAIFDDHQPSRKPASHISRARWDDSTKTMIAQVSVPVYDGDQMIGTLTIGVDLKRVPHQNH